MSKNTLFQYAVWYRDPKDSDKDELIQEVTSVKATSEDHVKAIALRALEAKWDEKLEHIKVETRPF